MIRCLKCQRELADREPAGRPPAYCSKACRRAPEYELRRLERRLDVLEEQSAWWKAASEGRHPDFDGQPRHAAKRAAFYHQGLTTGEARLRELLGGDTEGDAE